MPVGSQPSQGGINSTLTQLALAWRDLAGQTLHQWQYLNDVGTAGLEAIGFASADAAEALTLINYMATVAQVYEGTVQAQGTGGTGAILFDFDNALTPLWGGE